MMLVTEQKFIEDTFAATRSEDVNNVPVECNMK